MSHALDMIGRILARTYHVERLLGGGGMGSVYAARHVRTGGLCAVKLLHPETAADAEIYKRFQDEARTISALRHPHIVQVTDFDRDDDGTPFIVMEMLEGEDLYQRLCRVGKLSLEHVLDIGRQVGSALNAAHEKGIIHRDIKPQNVFLVRHEVADMVTELAKVVDFGISKIRRPGPQVTRDMTILGTPQFMSPEGALGQNSQMDGRADQWSLGVIMYLALSGRLPFDGENLVGVLYMVVHEQPTPLQRLAPELPAHVVAAIARAMSKNKEDRFPRMADFVRALIGQAPGRGPIRVTSGMPQIQIDGIRPPVSRPEASSDEEITKLSQNPDELLAAPPHGLLLTPSSPTAMELPSPLQTAPLPRSPSSETPTSLSINPDLGLDPDTLSDTPFEARTDIADAAASLAMPHGALPSPPLGVPTQAVDGVTGPVDLKELPTRVASSTGADSRRESFSEHASKVTLPLDNLRHTPSEPFLKPPSGAQRAIDKLLGRLPRQKDFLLPNAAIRGILSRRFLVIAGTAIVVFGLLWLLLLRKTSHQTTVVMPKVTALPSQIADVVGFPPPLGSIDGGIADTAIIVDAGSEKLERPEKLDKNNTNEPASPVLPVPSQLPAPGKKFIKRPALRPAIGGKPKPRVF